MLTIGSITKKYPVLQGAPPLLDPALGIETKRVALVNSGEITAVISSAKKAFPKWANIPLARRQ